MPATLRTNAGTKSRPPVGTRKDETQNAESKNPGGRPPKFHEPSRPITLTLPESTLDGLLKIDPDRGKAIVKLAEMALRRGRFSAPLVEAVEMAANISLIIIGPSAALRRIPFLHLIEVAPSRFLLAVDPGNDFKSLEIAIQDELENVPAEDMHERELLAQLLACMRSYRKDARVRMAEILFVQMDPQKPG